MGLPSICGTLLSRHVTDSTTTICAWYYDAIDQLFPLQTGWGQFPFMVGSSRLLVSRYLPIPSSINYTGGFDGERRWSLSSPLLFVSQIPSTSDLGNQLDRSLNLPSYFFFLNLSFLSLLFFFLFRPPSTVFSHRGTRSLQLGSYSWFSTPGILPHRSRLP